MTIIGTGFIGASAVTFNGASASFTVDLSTRSPAKVRPTAPIAVTTPGGWRGVGVDRSNTKGVFRERVSDRPGVYRAIAVRKELNGGNNVCLRDLSPRVKHRH